MVPRMARRRYIAYEFHDISTHSALSQLDHVLSSAPSRRETLFDPGTPEKEVKKLLPFLARVGE